MSKAYDPLTPEEQRKLAEALKRVSPEVNLEARHRYIRARIEATPVNPNILKLLNAPDPGTRH